MADENAHKAKGSGVKRRISLELEPAFDVLAFINNYVGEQARRIGMRTETIDELARSDVEQDLFPTVVGNVRDEMKDRVDLAVFVVRGAANAITGYAIILDKTHRIDRRKANKYPKLFEVIAIWVDEGNRGRGEKSIAHHLREKCFSWACEKGATHVMFDNAVKGPNGENYKAAQSLLKRGATLLAFEDRPWQRGEHVFVFDLKRDEILLKEYLATFCALFEIVTLQPYLTELCGQDVDIRDAILDGRLARHLVNSRGEPNQPLYCFGPTHRFADLGLKSLMRQPEFEHWFSERSTEFSLENRMKSKASRGSELPNVGEMVFAFRNILEGNHFFSLLELIDANVFERLMRAPCCFDHEKRSSWTCDVARDVLSNLILKVNQ